MFLETIGKKVIREILGVERKASIIPVLRQRPTISRPIDMGGPRDIWLTFMPSPDPRLDSMVPAQ